MPTQKIENTRAVFAGLDKITGRIISFDAAIGETVQFGALQVTARVCYTRPPTEATNTDAFVEVDEVTLQGEIKRVFNGWMFAASPGLHGVEHPIYDVWLTDCGVPAPTRVAEPAVQPTPAAATTTARPPRPRQATPRAPATCAACARATALGSAAAALRAGEGASFLRKRGADGINRRGRVQHIHMAQPRHDSHTNSRFDAVHDVNVFIGQHQLVRAAGDNRRRSGEAAEGCERDRAARQNW